MKKEGIPVGETHLYFGCMHKAHDFIYEVCRPHGSIVAVTTVAWSLS